MWDEWDRVSTSGANQVGRVFSKFSKSCFAKTGAEGFSEIEILNMSNTLLRIAQTLKTILKIVCKTILKTNLKTI